jgi:signal transduction histidine kinase
LAVTGDSVQLEQVMLNLLINARQALLGKGGSITIKATPSDDSQEVKIQISDTGAGIPAQHLSRIFEPFFTTKGTARNGEPKGTGLGLAICKEILDHHRGRIDVQSEPGRGTTFTLCLPMAQ